MIKYTNLNLSGHDHLNRKTDKGELLQWWGYALALTLNPGTPIDKMWSSKINADQILPPADMGRYGMTLNRWKKLRAKMAFGPSDDASFDADNWCFVRTLVDKFNTHMATVVGPSWLCCIDETMCAWRGMVGLRNPAKIPSRSWVPRKPEPLGAELKTLADALCGMMLHIEICEGKTAHAAQEYTAQYGVTTATTLRVCKQLFGTDTVVYGDSWFAGVKTAEAALENGFHFVGDVKTNTRRFCGDALEEATTAERGAWAVYTSEVTLTNGDSKPIFAISHRRGPAVHKFIATCGTSLSGHAHKATVLDDDDPAEVVVAHELERKCPRVLNDCTAAQPAIDRFNRYRQNLLAMEKRLLTNTFSMRFGTTMWGTVFCNAFFALRYFHSDLADFRSEMTKLSLGLMRNHFIVRIENPSPSPSSPPSCGRSSTCSPFAHDCTHMLISLKDVPGLVLKKGMQERCNVCNKKCTKVCSVCTRGPHSLFPICPEITRYRGRVIKHDCLQYHRMNPEITPRGRRPHKRAGKRQRREGECEECDEGEGDGEEEGDREEGDGEEGDGEEAWEWEEDEWE